MTDELLDIAGKVMENFNPATDSVADEYENVPDGEYSVIITDVSARENEKGTEWISLQCEVTEGDCQGRLIFVNYWFTEKTKMGSTKKIFKLAFNFNYELQLEAFENLETLAETLETLKGTMGVVTQTTNKNGYANHSIYPVE